MKRKRMCEDEIEKVWQGWRSGFTQQKIADSIGAATTSVYLHLRKYGGIKPRARARRDTSLRFDEPEEISRGLSAGCSIRSIATSLNRSPSTISREIKRNGGPRRYRAELAEKAYWVRAKRPKPCKLALNKRLKHRVSLKFSQDWSPEQISGWLVSSFPDEESMRVSHETIYKSLFVQSKGLLNKDLRDHLRTKRRFRQSKTKTNKGQSWGRIVDAVSISERPAEVEDRAVPGHWEGDLIAGDLHSHIVTLVERKTRFLILCKIDNRETETVISALTKRMQKLPEIRQQTLTWDRGHEMHRHAKFTMATSMDVYFCDTHSPCQRGSNENTNGLLRRTFRSTWCDTGTNRKIVWRVGGKKNIFSGPIIKPTDDRHRFRESP